MLVPVPVIPTGLIVQVPEGRLLSTTSPPDFEQVGWVMVPTDGADGVEGCAVISIFAVGRDEQPKALVTVNEYVPVVRPEIVVLVPVPVIDPGLMVHVPDEGRPFRITLPVATEHVGCTTAPGIGVPGVAGAATIVAGVATELHPPALLIMTL